MSGAALPLAVRLEGTPDPADAAERFLDLPWPILLDSTAEHARLGRYSFLSADPAAVIRGRGARSERFDATAGAWTAVADEPLAAVHAMLAPFASEPMPGVPPFQGGAAGYIGYDYGRVLERLPTPRFDDLAIPDVVLGLYDWVLAWDHEQDAAWIISTGLPESGGERARRGAERLAMVRARLEESSPTATTHSGRRPAPARPQSLAGPGAPSYPVVGVEHAEQVGLRSTFTHRGYLTAVARVREYILAGDIFQANLSQRFTAPLDEAPFAFYRRLRRTNPAAFGAYFDIGGAQVLSVSPERFLRLQGRRVETRPIKGTRPRGLGPMHDALLGLVLEESDKDRAENVMIVDLLRNDLSRVCLPGTVRVPELFALEQHPTVHHLVSTVVGELEPGTDAVDLLRATFPGGSITGAPKVRAMEIIAELEPSTRKIYCGSLGYLSVSGTMDTSIAIRTAVAAGGRMYFQAGGGIVADSDPESEYRETLDKACGIIRALAER
ncbi:MAG TPA: aminodeoxychorismate synthase component I [Gemmatimonadales bacterium]|nr:aminodeoxychorismate synthase component I [Gemmatimonadales bacterium]